jgi:hypothetical protein
MLMRPRFERFGIALEEGGKPLQGTFFSGALVF